MAEKELGGQKEIELEQHILDVKRKIYEVASEREPEKIRELISNVRK